MRATLKASWEWTLVVVFVAWMVSAFAAPHVASEITRWVVMPYGTFIVVRWAARWTRRRLRAGGVRALVPHKAPWAP